jgi:hypothetical protein
MKNRFTHYIAIFALIISTADAGQEARVRILGIGNSFTENATRYLPAIIQSEQGLNVDVAVAGIGGSSLKQHVTLAEAHEADAEAGKRYKYLYNLRLQTEESALKEILLSEDWDYVTIQQVSHNSHQPETYRPYAEQLVNYIKQYAPDAKIVLHETWAHSIDSYRTKDWDLDPDAMYARLRVAYRDIANELDLPVIPVGTAFEKAKATDLWNYQPTEIDTKALIFPQDRDNLPDMSRSLHQVFYWHPDAEKGGYKLVNDGFHANVNGKYLGGLVWYCFFTGADPREISYKPEGMSPVQAESLRGIAYDVINAPEGL